MARRALQVQDPGWPLSPRKCLRCLRLWKKGRHLLSSPPLTFFASPFFPWTPGRLRDTILSALDFTTTARYCGKYCGRESDALQLTRVPFTRCMTEAAYTFVDWKRHRPPRVPPTAHIARQSQAFI